MKTNNKKSLFAAFVLVAAGCSNAGAPASLSVEVTSQKPVFELSAVVELRAVARDAAGLEVGGVPVTWTVTPADAAETAPEGDTPVGPNGARYTVKTEGQVRFDACSTVKGADGQPLCGLATVLVDGGSPKLSVTSPTPGAELGGNGAKTIDVAGKATDTRTTHVYVNGASMTLGADGSFKATVQPRFGTNHIEIVASDGVSPDSKMEMDVLWAEGYGAAVRPMGNPGASYDDALVLQLGQRFFDDGKALGTTHPLVARDLADLVQMIVNALDLQSKIPDPLLSSIDSNGDGIVLRATGTKLDDVVVETAILDDGFDLYVRVTKLSLTTAGSVKLSGNTIQLDGLVTARASAYAHMTVRKVSPTTAVEVKMSTFDVALEQLDGQFADAGAAALFDLANGTLRTTLERLVTDTLKTQLQGSLPTALEGAFQSIDGALANITLPIDVSPLPKTTLKLNGSIAELDTTHSDAIAAKLALTVETDAVMAAFPMSRGVALTEAAPAGPPLFESPRMQLGVRLALLNSLMHSLWNSGLLDIKAGGSIPADVKGKLPPVVRPARPGENYDFVISLGQLELTPKQGTTTQGTFGVLLEAGVNITVKDGTLSLDVGKEPLIKVWVINPAPEGSLYTTDFVRILLHDVVWKQLQTAIVKTLAFKLPLPALDGLTGLAPSLSTLQMAIGQNGRPTLRNGYVVLDLDWTATLP